MKQAALLVAVFVGYYAHVSLEWGLREMLMRTYNRNGQRLVQFGGPGQPVRS